MKKTIVLAVFAALAAGSISAAQSADRWARGHRAWRHYAPHHGGPVYWVLRSPRFVPPPSAPNAFWWEFAPTQRVTTHMY